MKIDLEELLQQKALVEKHLTWLDKKIREFHSSDSKIDVANKPETGSATEEYQAKAFSDPGTSNKLAPGTEPDVDPGLPLLTSFSHDRDSLARDTKKGCLLWSVGLFLIIVLIFFLIYFFYPSWDEDTAARKLGAMSPSPTPWVGGLIDKS